MEDADILTNHLSALRASGRFFEMELAAAERIIAAMLTLEAKPARYNGLCVAGLRVADIAREANMSIAPVRNILAKMERLSLVSHASETHTHFRSGPIPRTGRAGPMAHVRKVAFSLVRPGMNPGM